MKYKVTIANLWLDGVKHRRGDIIETDEVISPSRAEAYTEPEKPVLKRRRKSKAEDSIMEELGFGEDSDNNE